MTYSLAYEHQSNGHAERCVRSLKEALIKFHCLGKKKALELSLRRLNSSYKKDKKTALQKFSDTSNNSEKVKDKSTQFNPKVINRKGYFLRRPDIDRTFEQCIVLTQPSPHTYIIRDRFGKKHTRSYRSVKILKEGCDKITI